jgi:predicted nucleic acid-binding protein
MTALETSSVIAYLSGGAGVDVSAVEAAMEFHQAVFPPIVVAELLSDPQLDPQAAAFLRKIPQLEILDGYWERAGELRAGILRRGLKAHMADTLVAQSCLDHDVALITRDKDFRHFAQYAGLRLR